MCQKTKQNKTFAWAICYDIMKGSIMNTQQLVNKSKFR